MTLVMLVLFLLATAGLVDLVVLLRSDGLGHRPPPCTHPPYFPGPV